MKKVEVKSNGIVIGYTYDNGKTIEFLNNEEASKVKKKMFTGQPLSISSRKMGTINGSGKIITEDLKELAIMDYIPPSDMPRLECINNEHEGGFLTIGKIYQAISADEDGYKIKDDSGCYNIYSDVHLKEI